MIAVHRMSGDRKSRDVPQGPKSQESTGPSSIIFRQGRGDDRNRLCWQPSNCQQGNVWCTQEYSQQVRTAEAKTFLSAQERELEYRLKESSWPMDGS